MAENAMLHASAVAIDGSAVLIRGKSGSGKSDLAFRLIDRGAMLVGDDYIQLSSRDGRLFASAAPNLAGKIELRGIGIVAMPSCGDAPVALLIDLDAKSARLPEENWQTEINGIALPLLALPAFHVSTPAKIELALRQLMDKQRQ